MKINDSKTHVLPPILLEYVKIMFDEKTNINVRRNYRDNIDAIRQICDEAVKKFDRDQIKFINSSHKNRKTTIRSAHAE